MLAELINRVRRARTVVRRATVLPLLVRCGAFFCALLAFMVAYPVEVVGGQLVLPLLVVAVAPALVPHGRAGTVAAVAAVVGWVADTTWYAHPVVLWRVVALAAFLYLGHTLTALAAVLPYDALVDLNVLTGWLARGLAVVLASSVLLVVVLSQVSRAGGPAYLAATLLGLAAAAGTALLLSRLLRRG